MSAGDSGAGAGSGRGRGATHPYGSYQVLGELRLKFAHAGADAPFVDYRRELNLGDAVARLTYVQDGVRYTREGFVSDSESPVPLPPGVSGPLRPEVFAYRLTADRPGAISFDLELGRSERATTRGVSVCRCT